MRRTAIVSGVAIAFLMLGMTLMVDRSAAATIVQVSEDSISPAALTIQNGGEVIWRARGQVHPQFELTPTAEGVRLRVTEGGDFAATFHTPGEYRYVVHIPKGGTGTLAIPGRITVK